MRQRGVENRSPTRDPTAKYTTMNSGARRAVASNLCGFGDFYLHGLREALDTTREEGGGRSRVVNTVID